MLNINHGSLTPSFTSIKLKTYDYSKPAANKIKELEYPRDVDLTSSQDGKIIITGKDKEGQLLSTIADDVVVQQIDNWSNLNVRDSVHVSVENVDRCSYLNLFDKAKAYVKQAIGYQSKITQRDESSSIIEKLGSEDTGFLVGPSSLELFGNSTSKIKYAENPIIELASKELYLDRDDNDKNLQPSIHIDNLVGGELKTYDNSRAVIDKVSGFYNFEIYSHSKGTINQVGEKDPAYNANGTIRMFGDQQDQPISELQINQNKEDILSNENLPRIMFVNYSHNANIRDKDDNIINNDIIQHQGGETPWDFRDK